MMQEPAFASKNQRGFTLIEIIVALVVISVALGAVISTTGSSVSHATHLKEKTIALWVARNHISAISMSRQWPSTGQQSDEASMAGKKWFIANKVTQTPDKNMRRMDLSVYADRKHTNQLVSLVAYINQPLIFNGNNGNKGITRNQIVNQAQQNANQAEQIANEAEIEAEKENTDINKTDEKQNSDDKPEQ